MNAVVKLDAGTGELLPNDADALEIAGLYAHARNTFVDSVAALLIVGARLIRKRDICEHGEWLPWLENNRDTLGFGQRVAYKLIAGAEKNANLPSRATLEPPQALAISRQIWGNHNHRAEGTGDNEWYTPERYIELAREVMGSIDLDPASCEQAQERVAAAGYFDEKENGLLREWAGRVWLNPPYAQPLIQHFVEKLVVEVEAQRVDQAVLLTHNYTDTEWFHIAANSSDAICFTRGRIQFESPEGKKAQPTQGQAFFYFGADVKNFAKIFKGIGIVVKRA